MIGKSKPVETKKEVGLLNSTLKDRVELLERQVAHIIQRLKSSDIIRNR